MDEIREYVRELAELKYKYEGGCTKIRVDSGGSRILVRPYPHWKQHASRDAQRNKMEPGSNCARHLLLSVHSVYRTLVATRTLALQVASRVASRPVCMGPQGLPSGVLTTEGGNDTNICSK